MPLEALGVLWQSWSLECGNLPQGLTLSQDGVISGTPTESGKFLFTVKTKAARSLETLRNFYPTTRRHIPEGSIFV
jgi:hypothetical protein